MVWNYLMHWHKYHWTTGFNPAALIPRFGWELKPQSRQSAQIDQEVGATIWPRLFFISSIASIFRALCNPQMTIKMIFSLCSV
mmetsp:Transcript_18618/g.28911  ORF Transcript_18618/g.28911 Transcript_18618/m.28911 type:complete len:83 (-) Transcript_18618:3678-3926(-)